MCCGTWDGEDKGEAAGLRLKISALRLHLVWTETVGIEKGFFFSLFLCFFLFFPFLIAESKRFIMRRNCVDIVDVLFFFFFFFSGHLVDRCHCLVCNYLSSL